ncbi:MAG: succinate dehydrogenase, cytochrome b556 subunit [Geminicoccaceae bacterium]
MASAERPLSPHLQVYKFYLTMAMSIFHRATGCALASGMILLVWWLVALATGPDYFATVQWFIDSWIGFLVLFGFTAAAFYHMGNGIRHLAWDFGYGFELKSAYQSGYMVLGFTAVATLITWIAIALA